MATRFYLPSTGEASCSPAFDAGWEDTSIAERRAAVTSKINSAMTSVEFTDNDSTDRDILFAQYVSSPLAAQTIYAQTTRIRIRGLQSQSSNNLFLAWGMRVVSNDGSVVRGTLVPIRRDNNTLSSTTLTNRADGYTCPSLAIQSGDRIVIEVGVGGDPTEGYTHGSTLSFGDDSDTDLPNTDGETSPYNPWVEFSQTLLFQQQVIQPAPVDIPLDIASATVLFQWVIQPTPVDISLGVTSATLFFQQVIQPTPVDIPLDIASATLLFRHVIQPTPVGIPLGIASATLLFQQVIRPTPVDIPLGVTSATVLFRRIVQPTPVDVPLGVTSATIALGTLTLAPSPVATPLGIAAPTIATAHVPVRFGLHPTDKPLRCDYGTGAPTYSAAEGTLYWDIVADKFYINNNGAAGWTALPRLDASAKVVEDPANATATPAASKIPIADANGRLDAWVLKPFGIVIQNPTAFENIGLGLYFPSAVTLLWVRAVLVSTGSPSVTWNLKYGSDRSAAGTKVWTVDKTTTNKTTGDVYTTFDNPTPSGFLWLVASASSGFAGTLEISGAYVNA